MDVANAQQPAWHCGGTGGGPANRPEQVDGLRETVKGLALKYRDLLLLAGRLGLEKAVVRQDGKLRLAGMVEYQLDVERLWDAIKAQPGWEQDIVADISARHSDVFGIHTIAPGETLATLAIRYLGDANRRMEIVKANAGTLADPEQLEVGRQLTIPGR
jgi:nucleoid-associated protein YgaU